MALRMAGLSNRVTMETRKKTNGYSEMETPTDDPLYSTIEVERLEAKVDILSNFIQQQFYILLLFITRQIDQHDTTYLQHVHCEHDANSVWEALEHEFNHQEDRPTTFNAQARPFVPVDCEQRDRNTLLEARSKLPKENARNEVNDVKCVVVEPSTGLPASSSADVASIPFQAEPMCNLGGDFRSLPDIAWCSVHANFLRAGILSPSNKFLFNQHDLLAILNSYADAIRDSLNAQSDLDFSSATEALKEGWASARVAAADNENLGEYTRAETDLYSALEEVRDSINTVLGGKHGLAIPELDFHAFHKCLQDHKVEQISGRSSAKSRNKGLTATPAWTGLAVRKQDVSIESARQAKINRHGGNSSAVSRNRHERRQKAPPLEKAPDGRRRAS